MAKIVFKMYLSYSQLCVFMSSLSEPFNNWSDRNYTQGFAWRPGSVSFRALSEEGEYNVNLFINEQVPILPKNCVRAFKVPFENTDGNIEIGSISDSTSLDIPLGKYSLQVEFYKIQKNLEPEIVVRLNKEECNFTIMKADEELDVTYDLDLLAQPAT
ncbi:MAG: hypothetical protein GY941_21190 [Planctomycetes bacterium]|nr:hypothetical protein [Planctomycetota bacterium]